MTVRLIEPYISFNEVSKELEEIFDKGMFTKGKYSKEFPKSIANYVNAKHAFLTTSATTALSLCVKLLEIGPGDEVAVSDFSFPATVNVVEDVGATPVFVDVSRETFNMLPEKLLESITEKTKAVIFVDAFGNPTDLDAIADICHERGIVLIEDAACAIGSKVNDVYCGALADLTCFSFHPRKLLTCGEGGAITTNNDEFAEKLKYKLNHGATESGEYVSYGYNYRLPEIACLMGLKQIEKLDSIVSERQKQAKRYEERLKPIGFTPQKIAKNVHHNNQSIVFVLPDEIDFSDLHDYLAKHGIETTIGTYCLSECKYYKEKYNDVQANASYLQHQTITLPCYTGADIDLVCDTIEEYKNK